MGHHFPKFSASGSPGMAYLKIDLLGLVVTPPFRWGSEIGPGLEHLLDSKVSTRHRQILYSTESVAWHSFFTINTTNCPAPTVGSFYSLKVLKMVKTMEKVATCFCLSSDKHLSLHLSS